MKPFIQTNNSILSVFNRVNSLMLSLFFILLTSVTFSQENSEHSIPSFSQYQKIQSYKAKVILKNQQIVKGLLYQVTEDKIILLPTKIDDYSHFLELIENGLT